MIGVAILPLLIILILFWIGMRSARHMKNYFKNKRIVKTLLSVYLGVLIISVFVYELLPKSSRDIKIVQADDLDKATMQLDEAIFNGKTEEVDPKLIRDNWELDYTGNEVSIRHVEGLFVPAVVVERKTENDGIIEGTFYASVIMNGVDYTDNIASLKLKLEENSINLIGNAGETTLNFAMYKKEFVITQFNGESWLGRNSSEFRDVRVLYLRIPKDLKLVDTHDIGIFYIGE